MRDDQTFTDRKLTLEEFSKKYWLDGHAEYQYHTGTIEDGRDEREQFLFNNIRALKSQLDFCWKNTIEGFKNTESGEKKTTALAVTGAVAGTLGLIAAVISWLR